MAVYHYKLRQLLLFSRGNGKTSSFYYICIHDIGPRVDRKNETGYKQEQEKEGYRRYKKESVWNLYNYGCVVSLSCDFENLGEDLRWQTWHYQQNLKLFIYFLKVGDFCLPITLVLLRFCYHTVMCILHFGNLQWICVIKSRGHLFNSFFFTPRIC